jgi:hypothetical protein
MQAIPPTVRLYAETQSGQVVKSNKAPRRAGPMQAIPPTERLYAESAELIGCSRTSACAVQFNYSEEYYQGAARG